jgi:EF hand
MLKAIIAFVLSGVAGVASPAAAQPSMFAYFDRDQNGRLTSGEISELRDLEIIAAMDTNSDGAVTPDEWLPKGRGSSFIEQGGVDASGVTRRWIDFKVVFFEFNNGVMSTSWEEGQAQLAFDATAQDVARVKNEVDARFMKPPETMPRAVGS